MNIRNHGIDTVKLTFANNSKSTVKEFNPQELKSLNTRLLTLSKEHNSKWTSLSNRLNIVDSGFTDIFSFQSNQRFSSIYVSLPKLVYGDNVNGLELKKGNIEECIEKLSDIIGFDAKKGRIQRLDYCFNFNTYENWYTLIQGITCKEKHYDKVVYNDTTLYFQNKSQQLCFYRQDEGRYKANHIKEINKIKNIKKDLLKHRQPADCLFRVEERLQRDALKNIKNGTGANANNPQPLLFSDLTNDSCLYHIFHRYRKLIKKPIYSDVKSEPHILDLSNITNTDEFNFQLLAFYISVNGMANVTNEFQSITFETPYHEGNVWKRIERARSLLDATPQHDSSAKIEELILREIDILFPQKSQPLF